MELEWHRLSALLASACTSSTHAFELLDQFSTFDFTRNNGAEHSDRTQGIAQRERERVNRTCFQNRKIFRAWVSGLGLVFTICFDQLAEIILYRYYMGFATCFYEVLGPESRTLNNNTLHNAFK